MILNCFVVSDKVAFQISIKVDQHNLWIWGSKNLHSLLEHEKDSTNFNVNVAMSQDAVFVLPKSVVTEFVCQYIL